MDLEGAEPFQCSFSPCINCCSPPKGRWATVGASEKSLEKCCLDQLLKVRLEEKFVLLEILCLMGAKNGRMKLTGFDRRGILYARQAQMVPSKSGAVELLRQIERGNPVLSEAPVITHLPGEEKSVELDEGGSGFPPGDSDGVEEATGWVDSSSLGFLLFSYS